jgi:hypothetical protein
MITIRSHKKTAQRALRYEADKIDLPILFRLKKAYIPRPLRILIMLFVGRATQLPASPGSSNGNSPAPLSTYRLTPFSGPQLIAEHQRSRMAAQIKTSTSLAVMWLQKGGADPQLAQRIGMTAGLPMPCGRKRGVR